MDKPIKYYSVTITKDDGTIIKYDKCRLPYRDGKFINITHFENGIKTYTNIDEATIKMVETKETPAI